MFFWRLFVGFVQSRLFLVFFPQQHLRSVTSILSHSCITSERGYTLSFQKNMLTNLLLSSILILLLFAAIAQEVERSIGSAEVTGPTPVSSFLTSLVFTYFRQTHNALLYLPTNMANVICTIYLFCDRAN